MGDVRQDTILYRGGSFHAQHFASLQQQDNAVRHGFRSCL